MIKQPILVTAHYGVCAAAPLLCSHDATTGSNRNVFGNTIKEMAVVSEAESLVADNQGWHEMLQVTDGSFRRSVAGWLLRLDITCMCKLLLLPPEVVSGALLL